MWILLKIYALRKDISLSSSMRNIFCFSFCHVDIFKNYDLEIFSWWIVTCKTCIFLMHLVVILIENWSSICKVLRKYTACGQRGKLIMAIGQTFYFEIFIKNTSYIQQNWQFLFPCHIILHKIYIQITFLSLPYSKASLIRIGTGRSSFSVIIFKLVLFAINFSQMY